MLPATEVRTLSSSPADRTRSAVFTTILTRGPLSRTDVSELTGLSQSTITKVVKPLISAGFIVEEKEEAQGPGRPAIPLRVNPNRRNVVGVKVAAHELTGVLINLQAEVLISLRRPLPSSEPEQVAAEVGALSDDLLSGYAGSGAGTEGIGVAFGGHVDGRTGTLRYSSLLGWRNVPVRELVQAHTHLATIVENDVNALAVAEQWFGAGRDVPSFAVVTVGAGVGCGLVIEDELVHGATGMAGELGHVVVRPGGDLCRCGSRGCLETLASEDAILDAIQRVRGDRPATIDAAAVLARSGDEVARLAFAAAGEALGQGMAALINLVNPARIVLSGEGAVASDLLMNNLRNSLRRHAFSDAAAECEVVPRPLADESWARGAAANALRHLIDRLPQSSPVPVITARR